jgi:2-phospho-L-lactate/phosphoenolpyruvate guanylyltransferase
VIPFKFNGAKSRMSPVLSPDERRLLAMAMLGDVLEAVSGFGDVMILARPGFDGSGTGMVVQESDLDLNDAINALIDGFQESGWKSDLMIVMADLDLITRSDIQAAIDTKGDVVLSPGRGGGTNMILIRDRRFRTCYQGQSFIKHRDLARRLGLEIGIYASYRSGCDIDEPDDLSEVLIHGQGRGAALLKELGFELSEKCRSGCVRISRDDQ